MIAANNRTLLPSTKTCLPLYRAAKPRPSALRESRKPPAKKTARVAVFASSSTSNLRSIIIRAPLARVPEPCSSLLTNPLPPRGRFFWPSTTCTDQEVIIAFLFFQSFDLFSFLKIKID